MKPPKTISEIKSSDDNFLSDIQRLALIKINIEAILQTEERNEIIAILSVIGDLCAGITHRESDETNVRNKYSDLLSLEALKCLKVLKEEYEKGLVSAEVLVLALPKIKSDLLLYKNNIDYIATQESERITRVSAASNLAINLGQISANAQQTQNIFLDQNSTMLPFMASYYIPKTLSELQTVSHIEGEFKWDSLIDRYYIARTFAVIGEAAKDIQQFCGEELKKFLHIFARIRDTVKESHVNLRVFAEFRDKEKTAKLLESLKDGLSAFEAEVRSINTKIANLSKTADYFLKLKEILKYNPNKIAVFEDSENKLRDRKENSEVGKFNFHLDKIKKKLEQIDKAKSLNLQLLQEEYFALVPQLTAAEQEYNFPKEYNEEAFKKFKLRIKGQISGIPKNIFDKIKEIQEVLSLDEKQKELEKLLSEYQKFLDSRSKEAPILSEIGFPQANLTAVEEFLNPQKDKKTPQMSSQKLSAYCASYSDEAERLQTIISFNPSSDEEERRKKYAIAHTIGIVGETIRYMLEIDEKEKILSSLVSQQLLRDIDETRYVRNKQVMHGVFSYDSAAVLKVATQNTIPWRGDVEAIKRIYNFIELIEKSDEELREGYPLPHEKNLTSANLKVRILYFQADAYLRLGQYQKAEEVLTQAKTLTANDKSFNEELVHINMMLSVVARKDGKRQEAIQFLSEALEKLETLPEEIINLLKARILNNQATMLAEDGKFEEAKKKFEEAIKFAKGDLKIYSICQLIDIMLDRVEIEDHDAALKLLDNEIEQEKEITKRNIFEVILLQRQKWFFLKSIGRKKEAEESFKIYQELSNQTELLKASLGYNYTKTLGMVFQDEADNFYCDGQYRSAIDKLNEAIKVMQMNDELNSERGAQAYLMMGNAYKYLSSTYINDIEKRNSCKEKAIKCFEFSLEVSKSAGLAHGLVAGHAHASLAEIQLRAGYKQRHQQSFNSAKEIFKNYGVSGERYLKIMQESCDTIRAQTLHSRDSANNFTAFGNIELAEEFMRDKKFESALILLNLSKKEMKDDGIVNPRYSTILLDMFYCHASLKKMDSDSASVKAAEVLLEIKDFFLTHKDCIADNFSDRVNKILKKFKYEETVEHEDGAIPSPVLLDPQAKKLIKLQLQNE